MLCSVVELGLGDDASGILELPEDAPVGMDLRDYLALDDHVLDIDLTPNRGDCFSVRGVAREAAANGPWELDEPSVEPLPSEHGETIGVTLAAPDGCARFAGRVITNIASGATSPVWLKERLRRVGLRAIHPVVDVTNYVMLELGQPLHGYDLRKIDGGVVARWGRADESLELLDGRPIDIADDMVVIADDAGPIGLAGIMGGASTAVDESTTDVFLEAAFFPPAAIAGRARRHGHAYGCFVAIRTRRRPRKARREPSSAQRRIAAGDRGWRSPDRVDRRLPRRVACLRQRPRWGCVRRPFGVQLHRPRRCRRRSVEGMRSLRLNMTVAADVWQPMPGPSRRRATGSISRSRKT